MLLQLFVAAYAIVFFALEMNQPLYVVGIW
jgi:hypothetical protein